MKKHSINLVALIIIAGIAFIATLLYTGFINLILGFLDHFMFANYSKIILIFLFSILFAITGTIVLLERSDPGRSLAWLLILLAIPIIGIILYLSFGQSITKKRRSKRKLTQSTKWQYSTLESNKSLPFLADSPQARMSNLLTNSGGCLPSLNNSVKVLNDGEEIFHSMLAAIEKAQHHINLETYIFREDHIGNHFIKLLEDKAAKGVQIRVIIDGIGSFGIKKSKIRQLKEKGIHIEVFFPVSFTLLHNKLNYRNHRKILVVDGHTSFVGGANIGDDYLGMHPDVGNWRDTHLEIHGAACASIQKIFFQDWLYLTKEDPLLLSKDFFDVDVSPYGNKIVQIVASGPDAQWQSVMQAYYYAIASAKQSITITSPYFIPNETIITGLKTAALAGINVRILLPQNPDHKLVYYAAMTYLDDLIEVGAQIYLYQNGFIHSKVMTIDDTIAIVGTANMDQRSFSLNFEINAVIYSKESVQQLNDAFEKDLKYSRQLAFRSFKDRSYSHRIVESACRLLSPIL